MPSLAESFDPRCLEREAEALLADALAQVHAPRSPGARQRHRVQLERVIELAGRARAASERSDPKTAHAACATLVKALAARARDARHGAEIGRAHV